MSNQLQNLKQALQGRACVSYRELERVFGTIGNVRVHVQMYRKINGRKSIINVHGTGYKLNPDRRIHV